MKRTRTAPTGLVSGERGEGCRGVALGFLAAKTAAHARALHHHFIDRQMQHVRDHILHFRRMLRGGGRPASSILARFRPGRVRLQIKMFLPAQFEFAVSGVNGALRKAASTHHAG